MFAAFNHKKVTVVYFAMSPFLKTNKTCCRFKQAAALAIICQIVK